MGLPKGKEKLLQLVEKWQKESDRLRYEMDLVSGSRYYSALSEEEKKEWNHLRDRSYGYLACANELRKELEAL